MANAYTYRPPCSAERLHDLYWNQGKSQTEVAAALGTTQKVIWRAMKKAGIPTRAAAARDQSGAANSNWKGGRRLEGQKANRPGITSGGYWYVHAPDHPNARADGYVAEHIVIATEGRAGGLESGEVVHHVDLNKRNNAPENLAIGTRKRHAEWHNQLEEVAVEFMRAGWIAFDPERGYHLTREVPPCP